MIRVAGREHEVKDLTLPRCLQVFLMASYQYYIRHYSLIEDHEFDLIARKLLDGWNEFEHQHKHLVTPGDLSAGTLYSLRREDYPTVVIAASETWGREKFYEDSMNGKEIGQ